MPAKTKVTVNIIVGDRFQDEFMHRADVFEPFKHLGNIFSLEMEGEGEVDQRLVDSMKRILEREYFVTAIWVASNPKLRYVDWSVKAISDGEKWGLLAPYLKMFGIEQEEPSNEQDHIQSTTA